MSDVAPSHGVIHFGAFQVDLRTGELRKHGFRIRLQDQPFHILQILLEQPGELITRQELQRQIWPADTFVDSEKGLNNAIMKLRDALGDSIERPHFIETIPRRGYRFIAPATRTNAAGPKGEEASTDEVSAAARSATFVAIGSRGKLRLRWKVIVPAVITVVALAGSDFLFFHSQPKLTNRDTIVLADFTNTTGDAVFDGTLRQGLSIQLEQSPFLSIISDQQIQQTLQMMRQKPDAKLTPEIARELCQRTSSAAVLDGSVAQIGTQYLLTLKAVNCVNGNSLASTEAQARDKNHVLDALGKAASEIRHKLGESLSSVEKYSTPLAEATTPSLEALKAYSLARKTQFSKGDTAALLVFKRAAELDPNFAMSYAAMSMAYGNLNEVGRSAECARKAYELREKVSDRERLYIEGNYYLQETGELERAAHVYELWLQTYPRDDVPYRELAAISCSLGKLEKCLEQAREALRLEPNNGTNYQLLGNAYMNLNRLDEAEEAFNGAEKRNLVTEDLLVYRYLLAFLKGDAAQMSQSVSAAMGKPGTENELLAGKADTEGWYGKLKNASELTRQAMDSAEHNDANETAATYQVAAALREVESGIREQARAEAAAALKLAPNHDVQPMAALVLARAGHKAGAERLAADIDKRFPIDTLIQRYWLPTIRAAVALERNDPNRGIELLKATNSVELSQPAYINVYLCPVYLRGQAYLMLHDGNAAAAEFQKFIDHRGLAANFPWGALAHLGLARAYSLQGDTAKAKAAYQDFLTLWKDADPDIPILIAAKAEYAKLH